MCMQLFQFMNKINWFFSLEFDWVLYEICVGLFRSSVWSQRDYLLFMNTEKQIVD